MQILICVVCSWAQSVSFENKKKIPFKSIWYNSWVIARNTFHGEFHQNGKILLV